MCRFSVARPFTVYTGNSLKVTVCLYQNTAPQPVRNNYRCWRTHKGNSNILNYCCAAHHTIKGEFKRMDKLFNMDNKFFTVMGHVADLMILNIVFLICCLPVVTIGASLTALHYVTLKMARNEESYIVRSFFKYR